MSEAGSRVEVRGCGSGRGAHDYIYIYLNTNSGPTPVDWWYNNIHAHVFFILWGGEKRPTLLQLSETQSSRDSSSFLFIWLYYMSPGGQGSHSFNWITFLQVGNYIEWGWTRLIAFLSISMGKKDLRYDRFPFRACSRIKLYDKIARHRWISFTFYYLPPSLSIYLFFYFFNGFIFLISVEHLPLRTLMERSVHVLVCYPLQPLANGSINKFV